MKPCLVDCLPIGVIQREERQRRMHPDLQLILEEPAALV